MSDNPERSSKNTSEQTFPLLPLTDFSRFDNKLFDKNKDREPSKSTSAEFEKAKPIYDPSSLFKIPSILEKQNKPEQIVPSNPFPAPFKDTQHKATDKTPKILAGPDGRIEITEKDFGKIGPKAADVLKQAGVSKLTITPGQGYDTYEAEFKKPLEIPQDPAEDGTRKLKIATRFKADVSKSPDGTLRMDNIEGLSAETKVLLKWRDATVNKIELRSTPDGKSEIKSTGSWNGFSRDNTRVKPGEIFEKANMLFDRMEQLKKTASPTGTNFLEIPKLHMK